MATTAQIPLRYELKYLLSETDYLWLRDRLAQAMAFDSNANSESHTYHIRSLYFDDVFNSAYYEKQNGDEIRHKYRIRVYNFTGDIMLEKKSKYGSMTAKLSAPMSRSQCDSLLLGDYNFLYPSNQPLFEEMYGLIRTKLLQPRVIVDYEREAYIYPSGNIRITFDKNLHTGQFSTDLFVPEMSPVPAMQAGMMILEVKYDTYLPTHIRALLQGVSAQRMAISKYTLCRAFQ